MVMLYREEKNSAKNINNLVANVATTDFQTTFLEEFITINDF